MAPPPSIAVIGCGAIAEHAYLPALSADVRWGPNTWLVEPNLARGHGLAQRFGFRSAQVVASADHLPRSIALAINATPSHVHLPTTLALIQRGTPTLVEKPFAENARDATTMIEAARAAGCVLSVNQSRRGGPSNTLVYRLLRQDTIGSLQRIVWHEGHKFDWPSQSGFNFRRPWTGRARGTLLDIGVHVLDLLCWWFDRTPSVLAATMDGHGGPEASLAARLTLAGAPVDLKLSYLGRLGNRFLIEGTAGSIRGSTADYDRIEVKRGQAAWTTLKAKGSTDPVKAAAALIDNVLGAAAGREALAIDAASTVPALTVIDELYSRAEAPLSACYRAFAEPLAIRPDPALVEMVA